MDEVRNLFQNWFGQLVERIVRLDQYLSERKASAPTRVKLRRNIVSELLSSLYQLAEELHEKATFFLSDKSPESRRSIYYAFVLEATGRYRRLHALINYIPAPWPSPHLELFLTKVLEEGGLEGSVHGQEPMLCNTLLSADYNFSHILVPIAGASAVVGQLPLQNLLTVPSAEKDNPLMWPNLLHELAHVIGQEVIDAAQECLTHVKAPQIRSILGRWTHEIVADLIAADYLGPAYFGSFVTFCTYWVPQSPRLPTTSHPAPDKRVEYLFHYLNQQSPDFITALKSLYADYQTRLQMDYEDFKSRNSVFDAYRDTRAADKPFPLEELRGFVSEIVALPEFKKIRPRTMNVNDALEVQALARYLKEGQLIASRRDNAILRDYKSVEDVRKDYRNALSSLQEKPNDVRLILNAALIRRLSDATVDRRGKNSGAPLTFHAKLLDDYCKSKEIVASKRLMELRQTVNNLDSVISKSMEATTVMAFYQSYQQRQARAGE